MSHAPWSISKANMAHECTFRFHLRYTKRTSGKRIESSAGRIGTAAHEILERMLRGADFRTAFTNAAIKDLTRTEMLELKTYEAAIHRFFEIFSAWREKMGRPEVYPEQKLAFTVDRVPTEYWDADVFFRGVLDINVLINKNGELWAVIIDHKSGDVSDIEKYQPQLDAYVAMAAIIYPELAGAQAAIHWLRAQEALDEPVIAWGKSYKRPEIEKYIIPQFLGYLEEAETLAQGRPTPTDGWFCQFCEYQDICPIK